MKLSRGEGTAAKSADDNDEPRVPPPPATPLDFPVCCPKVEPLDENAEDLDFVKLFSNILRTGPNHKHLKALNVDAANNVPLDELLPQPYLPPSEWEQDPSKSRQSGRSPTRTPPHPTLSNGGPLPEHEAFFTRLRELAHDNEDVFRNMRHLQPKPNRPPARVFHFRKFWENLSYIAEYWDASADNYSKPTENDTSSSAMDIDDLASEAQSSTAAPPEQTTDSQTEETYTGHRKDTGKNMPGKYREDTVFAFVEPIVWCFRCRLEHARMQPRLKIQGMILPIPHNGNIYRTPENSREARRGILEGPLAGVFTRDQVTFRRPEDAPGDGKQEILDLLREVGLMLMMAQKRAREGTQEDEAGEKQWWATKPRWGGGPGGELGIPEEETVEETVPVADGARKRPRKMNRAALWKEVRPPGTMWEKGITYLRVGKAQGCEHDDVSPLSCVLSTLDHSSFPLKREICAD
ncbi:uncharacterized protein KY384_002449 [Bacidia gigantensis]|uniref:uncharacterized protein n=1 Tax=Bacidia gigantensis TaxID=2732470 RepID=UPI001D05BE9D|nr:uncharacterized protein KY384_002449 [Bacidia gigantensis]KAG8532572.1 hypothetical protein KY384_002449 [Bacidia gigantensis]